MLLNPIKCSFGVQAEKLLGFMLTKMGIKENLDMCQVIIDMKSLTNVIEFQQLAGCLTALSSFLSCVRDKAFLFFFFLKKNKKFKWTGELKEAFSRIKASSHHCISSFT